MGGDDKNKHTDDDNKNTDSGMGMGEEDSAKQGKNIVQLAVGTPSLSTLVSAVQAASLADVLSGSGPFTVFAPTNKAFEKVPAKVLSALLEPVNKASLQELLKYHVAAGDVKSGMLKDGQKVPTLEGSELTVSIKDGVVHLNGVAEVVQADVVASNGVVHVIDTVLVPPGLEALVASLADPVNDGYSAGDDKNKHTDDDNKNTDSGMGMGEEDPAKQSKNIVQLAVGTPSLSTLVGAVQAASLAD